MKEWSTLVVDRKGTRARSCLNHYSTYLGGGGVVAIAGHNRRWIDGLILMVMIDTIGLIFINVINPSVTDFLFLNDSIENQS